MADIVLDVGFNQTEVDKEIDKLEKKIKSYEKALKESDKILDSLEKQYAEINTQLEIEKNLHGENNAQVKALQFELDVIKKKLNEEYAIMDRIQEKAEQIKRARRDAYLAPAKFSPKSENKPDNPRLEKLPKHMDRVKNAAEKTSNAFSKLGTRLLSLVKNVFVFSVITSVLRGFREHINNVISSNDQLSASLNTIKINLQSAFMPIYQAVLPALQTLMNWLAKVTAYIAAFVNTLFGKTVKESRKAAQALNNQAKSTKSLAAETKKANKEMNKQLAGFDELNVLSKETADNLEDLGGGATPGDSIAPITPIIDFDTSRVEDFARRFSEKLAPIREALDELKEHLEPFKEKFFTGLQWSYDNVLKPLGEWSINELGPTSINTLCSALDFLNSILDVVSEPFDNFVQEVLKPMGEWTGDKIIEALNLLGEAFDEMKQGIEKNSEDIKYILNTVVNVLRFCWNTLAKPTLNNIWDTIKGFGRNILKFGRDQIDNITKLLKGIIDFIEGVFTGDFKRAGKGLVNIFAAIGNTLINVLESLINRAKTMMNFLIGNINTAIGLINKLPGVNIPNIPKIPDINLPRIPYLAQGAVIPPNKEFLAVLGDQKSGTNIEAPLDTIKQALAEVLAQNDSNAEYTFIAQLDGRTLFSETVKRDRMYKKQSGKSAFAY